MRTIVGTTDTVWYFNCPSPLPANDYKKAENVRSGSKCIGRFDAGIGYGFTAFFAIKDIGVERANGLIEVMLTANLENAALILLSNVPQWFTGYPEIRISMIRKYIKKSRILIISVK